MIYILYELNGFTQLAPHVLPLLPVEEEDAVVPESVGEEVVAGEDLSHVGDVLGEVVKVLHQNLKI